MKTTKRGADGKAVRRICGRRLSWHAPVLTITLSYTDGTEEATEYRVEEVGSDVGRSFDLTRWTRPGERGTVERHRVSLAGNGQNACGCKANAFKGTCKHVEAIRFLIDSGRLPGGYPADGAPEWPGRDWADEI